MDMSRDGAIYVMHGNFRLFARAILALNRIGEELYFEPNAHGLSIRSLNSNKSAYATCLFSKAFFNECYLNNFEANTNNVCRISTKCVLSAFKSMKNNERTILSCRMYINPRSDFMIIQLMHIFDVVKSYEVPFFECTAPLRSVLNKTDLPNYVTCPSAVLLGVLSNLAQDSGDVMFCIKSDSFMMKNYFSNEQNKLKSEAKIPINEFGRFRVAKDVDIILSIKEFKAIVLFADSYQAQISMYFDEPGEAMVIALENDVNFSVELILATNDKTTFMFQASLFSQLHDQSDVFFSGAGDMNTSFEVCPDSQEVPFTSRSDRGSKAAIYDTTNQNESAPFCMSPNSEGFMNNSDRYNMTKGAVDSRSRSSDMSPNTFRRYFLNLNQSTLESERTDTHSVLAFDTDLEM